MSDTCRENLRKGMQRSFIDYEDAILPKFTIEELSNEIEKGEKSFFTPKALVEMKDFIQKSELSEEASEDFANQIKKLQKVAIVKGEDVTGYGYFLEKGTYKDNPANRKAGRVGQTYGGKKEKESSGKSDAAKMVLQGMDSEEGGGENYQKHLSAALKKFPNVSKESLEKELDKYI